VSNFERRGAALEPVERRPAGSRFVDLGDRLARAFSTSSRTRPSPEGNGERELPAAGERALPWEEGPPRFPITRQGYDCAAVEEYVADLERELADQDRELAELRSRTASKNEVAAELERVGEQTSAILLAAHEKAQETGRLARSQADKCVSDAASNAVAITEDAKREVRQLEMQKTSLCHQRGLLLEDVRSVATALSALAEDAAGRFRPELENPTSLTAAASQTFTAAAAQHDEERSTGNAESPAENEQYEPRTEQ
jgi:DivIVA protein